MRAFNPIPPHESLLLNVKKLKMSFKVKARRGLFSRRQREPSKPRRGQAEVILLPKRREMKATTAKRNKPKYLGSAHLGIEKLVALFSPLEPLDSLVVHLLCHFFVALLLLLCSPTVSDVLDMRLGNRVSETRKTGKSREFADGGLWLGTLRSASFSSLSSFSCSLTASWCLRASSLFAYEVMPLVGRNGFLVSCQFFPAGPRQETN